jgi:predicted nucleic acid-binding Zn ribbon protein
MICDKCNKKLKYVRDVVDDPFMFCPGCLKVWAEVKNG